MRANGFPNHWITFLAALLWIGLGSGCSSDTPTSVSYVPGSGPGSGPVPPTGMIATGPLASAVTTAMDRAIQDEYGAEQMYARVLEDFGNVLPFANVVHAETRHSESLARLYVNHEMTVPESGWTRDNVARFFSIPEACAAAVTAEESNIAMYDDFLRMELPYDVERVMTANREASLSSHLPAFRLCASS